MPTRMQAGDVLADRYRLDDLLAENGSGRFWRAHDLVLHRPVAIHVLAADDERAEAVLEAARGAGPLNDRRLLRVLDAETDDGRCYVVNEWGQGDSLDILLVREGPLPPRRAAWLVGEVADSIARAHASGLAHGRLVPENVLLDQHGQIRIIGFGVDAALRGLAPGRTHVDEVDLAGLLYCALTGTWPGVSESAIQPAPEVHGEVMRPRRVRAGIPRMLDTLCDEILNPEDRSESDVRHSAREICDALQDYVGDVTGAHLPAQGPRTAAPLSVAPPSAAVPPPGAAPGEATDPGTDQESHRESDQESDQESEHESEHESEQESEQESDGVLSDGAATGPSDASDASDASGARTEVQPAAGPATATDTPAAPDPGPPAADPGSPTQATDLPTQAGMPVFHDDDEVGWLRARAERPEPPPPLEEPPPKPLFAPDPPAGEPVRRPRPGSRAASANRDYWPWDASQDSAHDAVHDSSHDSGVRPLGRDTGSWASRSWSGDSWGLEEGLGDVDDQVPGRSWIRLAMIVGVCVLVMVAAVAAYQLGLKPPTIDQGDEPSPTTTPSVADPTPFTDLTADDFDPQGAAPREENPESVPNVLDGDPATSWRTSTYKQNFGPAGLKTGVGLIVDLGATKGVRQVVVTTEGGRTSLAAYVTSTAPTGIAGLTPVGTASGSGELTISRDEPVSGRYVTIWLTLLPSVGDGFRGTVSEVQVLG